MTYKFGGFVGHALSELNGLPQDVRDGPLFDRILELLEAPWDAFPEPRDQATVRQAFFGETSEGLLTFIIDEKTETLWFTDIAWLG